MELHQVRYFLALCREKNFTRAARQCGVSQPSLSNAIKRLEAELGGRLFHRNRLNCVLSELGQAVQPHLAKLDQCASDARAQAERFLAAPPAAATAAVPLDRSADVACATNSDVIATVQNNQGKERTMGKPSYFIGACALVAATALVWSQTARVAPGSGAAPASLLAATLGTPAISPIDMMSGHNGPLPVEQWDAF